MKIRNIRQTSLKRTKLVVAVTLLALLAACGNKKDAAAGSGQVLASVDGQEITIHQLNTEMSKVAGTAAPRQMLDGLVARQVLVNEAKKQKLDSDPAVLAELERARDLVLAQSYVRLKIGMPQRPTAQEIEDFYQQNPDAFAQRKQFEFAQLVISINNLTPELNELMGSNRSLDDIANWLDSRHIQYARLQVVKSSGDLPAEMLKSFKTMDKGRLFIVKEGQNAILASMQDSKNIPMALAVARPQIEQILMTQKQTQMTDAAIARLKTDMKVEYTAKGDELKAPAPVAQAPAATTAASAGKSTADDSVARGAAGFK